MLDPLTWAQIWTELTGLTRDRGIGLLMVTHNPALVSRLCDDAIYLKPEFLEIKNSGQRASRAAG